MEARATPSHLLPYLPTLLSWLLRTSVVDGRLFQMPLIPSILPIALPPSLPVIIQVERRRCRVGLDAKSRQMIPSPRVPSAPKGRLGCLEIWSFQAENPSELTVIPLDQSHLSSASPSRADPRFRQISREIPEHHESIPQRGEFCPKHRTQKSLCCFELFALQIKYTQDA